MMHWTRAFARSRCYPGRRGSFVKKGRSKTFFARDACGTLDLGFHRGQAKTSSKTVSTRISQIHMHNKPFDVLQKHARLKMEGRVSSFDRETLLAHREARGKGMHLVDEILFENETEYHAHIKQKHALSEVFTLDGFVEALRASGVDLPY